MPLIGSHHAPVDVAIISGGAAIISGGAAGVGAGGNGSPGTIPATIRSLQTDRSVEDVMTEKSTAKRSGAKYAKSAGKDVKSAMHRRKKGTLKSGKGGKAVKSRKQAIAIGLSEARAKGKKVPKKKTAKKAGKKTARKSSGSKR